MEGIRLGILGGTGEEGQAFAVLMLRYLSQTGVSEVLLGSRTAQRAQQAVDNMKDGLEKMLGRSFSELKLRGVENAEAAEAEIVVVALPFGAVDEYLPPLAEALGNKVVINLAVPLRKDERGDFFYPVPEEGSGAAHVQALLPESSVVSIFNGRPAHRLEDDSQPLGTEILFAADRYAAVQAVNLLGRVPGLELVPLVGLRQAAAIEASVATILQLRKTYRGQPWLGWVGIGKVREARPGGF